MSRNEIYKKLNAIFRDVFDDDSIAVTDATTADDVAGWDSLAHITLIASIEDEFGFKFEMKQVVSMKNVGEMVDIIEEEV